MSEDVGQWWNESDGSVGTPPDAAIHEVLRWVIRQLHYGNFRLMLEEDGRPDTLMVGRAAAPDLTGEQFASQQQKRSFALVLTAIMAKAREGGIEPEHLDLAETLRFRADDNVLMNTEFHYALELMDILATIRARAFELINLPLVGKAPEGLILLIREATRCHLFGLHKACAALCRAALERTIKERIPPEDILAECTKYPRRGHLENMINLAGRTLLDSALTGFAHAVRNKGNDVMHGTTNDVIADSFVVLSDTRLIIERLFADA